jgi:hypothetical protein
MRIVPVMGDLPAVASLGEVPTPPAAEPDVAPPRVAPASAASGADAGTTGDRRLPRPPVPLAFDPPLIAQRAVLGLPVGPLIAEHALAEGIDYGAACAAVDRAMPAPKAAAPGEH